MKQYDSHIASKENDSSQSRVVRFSTIPEIVFQISKRGVLLKFTAQKENDLLISSNEVIGKNIYDVMPPDITQPIMRCVEEALQTSNQQIFDHALLINTKKYQYEITFIVIDNDNVLVIVNDITESKNIEKQQNHLLYNDNLTNLPNRYLMRDRLNQLLASAIHQNRLLAMLLIDLDNFKNINDTVGHTAGDQLLQDFAKRLSKYVRQADSISRLSANGSNSMVARLGGDEFAVLLAEINNIEDCAKVSDRIIDMLSKPFKVGDHEIFLTVSIGIAAYPFDGKEADTLIKYSEIAMYKAKEMGRNNYQYYSQALNVFSLEKFNIEHKLKKALDHNEFMLFYQPQINILTGELIGVEALIRWLQPDMILVKPDDFIPVAEEVGVIMQIGEWVLHTACSQSLTWQKEGMNPICITVNVSSIQFRQHNFVESISQILRDTGLNPIYLQLELTESSLMQNSEDNIEKLYQLNKMGIQISIDDFGTGYSSLSYLKRFPISTLKIDMSFIHELETNPNDQSITKATIDIANNFQLRTIAEGVETKKQLQRLKAYGCEGVQGYLICPPINSLSLAQFVKEEVWLKSLKKYGITFR